MAVSGTDRNYTSLLNGGTSTKTNASNVYNAVFSDDKDNKQLDVSDFMDLMIKQLTNQDFTNPMDDTAYMAQLAQFSSLEAMKELSSYSKSNYATSLLGKNVTVSQNKIGGGSDKDTGTVSSVSIVDNEYKITVNKKTYSLSAITSINQDGTKADSTNQTTK